MADTFEYDGRKLIAVSDVRNECTGCVGENWSWTRCNELFKAAGLPRDPACMSSVCEYNRVVFIEDTEEAYLNYIKLKLSQ